MKKRYIYSGIGVVFLLICLGLVWRGTGDDVLSGKTAGETGLYEKQVPFLYRDALMGEILHSFEPWVWDVKKVDWGPEELVKHMWEQMAQLRNRESGQVTRRTEAWESVNNIMCEKEKVIDSPWAATGYIQIFTEPLGQGSLREYAVVAQGFWQYTYLVTDECIYQIYSTAGLHSWGACMQELLQSVPQWQITAEEAEKYVHSFELDRKALYGRYDDIDRLSVWYDDMNFLFTEEYKLLECQSDMEGSGKSRLRIRFWNPGEEQKREMQIGTVDMPVFNTYEEWREYLQTLHPEQQDCYFFTYTAGKYCADPFIMLEVEEMQYGYFQREGQWYQICFDIPGNGDYFDLELRNICYELGYEYLIPSYWWCMDEKGNILEADLMQDVYRLVEEISPGQIFSFECTMVRAQENDIWDEKVYQVAVTAQGEEEPFQVFEVESSRGNGDGFSSWDFDNAFYFVDFNADGFQDLEVLYYYGANGGSVRTFVWSPSRGEFVRMPEELGNWDYRVYFETRQLNQYFHGSALSGASKLYQWSGEMDYELIRYEEYSYEDVWDEDGNYIEELYYTKIVAFDQGREKVLTDYTYDSDDDSANYVGLLYGLDVAWEKKVAVTGQDKPCILRYAQNKATIDGDGQKEVHLDYLFLFREDTYLICALPGQEAPAAYADLAWEEETQQLVVHYEDDTRYFYQWDGAKFHFSASHEN